MPAFGAHAATTITFTADELLGKPEATSITINIVPETTIEYHYQYGLTAGANTWSTSNVTATGGQPHEVVISGLTPNTQYFYRMQYHLPGESDWVDRTEHSFWTQRAQGSTFTFTVTSDSHATFNSYHQNTMTNILNEDPDFEIDLGDTFYVDSQTTQSAVNNKYLAYRDPLYMDRIGPSVPIFLSSGNHEDEEGWNLDDTFSLAQASIQARKLYFPTPVTDGFYSGNTDILAAIDAATYGDQLREDYYAWTWGDALFVVIDPFQYTMTLPYTGGPGEPTTGESVNTDQWGWTLGSQQFNWLKTTLQNSTARYKFVFSHQMVGGITRDIAGTGAGYVRGGAEAAGLFEWGDDSTEGFVAHRNATDFGSTPLHQLFAANGVSSYFHGHDHQYVYETRGSVVYQEVPSPSMDGSGFSGIYTEGAYATYSTIKKLPSTGHLLITVSPDHASVDYISSGSPTIAATTPNGEVAYTYDIAPNIVGPTHVLTTAVSPSGAGTISPSAGDHPYGEGAVVSVTATAYTGYVFSSWTGCTSSTATCSVTMDADKTVTANFKAVPTYDLTTAVSPSGGGTINPSVGTHTYNSGDVVNVTATANSGYAFSSWSGACTDSGACSVTMDTAKSITANFSSVPAETISYLGSLGAAVSKTSGTSLVITTSAAVTTGDDIIVAVATDPNSSLVVSVADPAGNSYSQVGYVVNTGNIRTYLYAAYDVNSFPSGSSITITASPAVTARAAVVALFRGLADSSPLDQTKSGTGSSTAPSSGVTSTTAQVDELLVGVFGTEGPDGDTAGKWDSSFIAGPRLGTTGGPADTNITAALGYRIVSSTGAYTASKTGITARDWGAMIATFKAGASGTHPAIFTTGTPLGAFNSLPGSLSAEQTYTVSGSGLTDAITITTPADFQISLSSGSGFASSLVISPSGGSVAATPIYVRFNRATEGTSTGYLAHTSSGATTRNIAVSGTSAPLSPVSFNILLGRPEDVSITANIIPDQDVEFYIEYGTSPGTYIAQTTTYTATANQPVEFAIGSLSANTRYYYRIVYRRTDTTDWNNGAEHSFITQRPSGSSFTFTVTSDSHLGQYGGQTTDELALWQQTLSNVAADHPDFHIDMGDTFPMDPSPLGTGMTDAEAKAVYLYQRPYLGTITDSIPYFQALGNHENEEGWNFDDVFSAPDQSLALVGMKYRKLYYPNPVPDAFYTGNTDPLDEAIGGDTNHEDYYAWEWGDALFVVIDPYHYSMTWPSEGGTYGGEGQDGEVGGDRWDWSLGIQQYLWLKSTLENSDATYKFVFTHQVTGGSTVYGRGGIGAAPYFEWGGEGDPEFDAERPASEGWTLPVHQLMVESGVDIFFHGHDHIYSYEQLDGIEYVECAKPDDAGYAWDPYGYGYTEGLYPDGVSIQNSGYLRVSVSLIETKVEYVRSYLPGDGTNGTVAHSFTVSGAATTTYTLAAGNDGHGTVTLNPSGGTYTSGATVTLTPMPSTGYQFSSWSGTNAADIVNTSGVYTIVMNGNKTVQANFVINTYSLNVIKPGTGSGSVTSAPEGIDCGSTCTASFDHNTSVTLTATAETGSTFAGWSSTCTGSVITCTILMEAAKTVTAIFTRNTDVTHTIPLVSGWNLVSFNVHPASTTIADVLVTIAGKYDLVYAWDASGGHSGAGNWMRYAPGIPGNTLATLDETQGFWIRMTGEDNLEITGTVPTTTNIRLSTNASGWNLVGYPSDENRTMPEALATHGLTDYSLVYAYHADDADTWKRYAPGVPGNDLLEVAPAWAYWIKVTAERIWDVEY